MATEAGMPRDYEDLYDLENLDDEELHDLVLQEMSEYPDLDPDLIDVRVEDGFVTLEGRVGTEQELQQFELVLSEVLGISNYSNNLVIDQLVRAEHSEGADDAVVEDEEVDAQLGEAGEVTEPSADHLMESLEGELYGTQDLHRALERGETYQPPIRPVQEGIWSEEDH